ncbi:MAG: hypothetical protein RL427_800 [Bacteroidota bacterium]
MPINETVHAYEFLPERHKKSPANAFAGLFFRERKQPAYRQAGRKGLRIVATHFSSHSH